MKSTPHHINILFVPLKINIVLQKYLEETCSLYIMDMHYNTKINIVWQKYGMMDIIIRSKCPYIYNPICFNVFFFSYNDPQPYGPSDS